MTGVMNILCIGLYGEAVSVGRERLFNNSTLVEIKDDAGQLISSHPDWDEVTYAEIIKSYTEEDDHVYLIGIATGKEISDP